MYSPDMIFITETWLHNDDMIVLPDICNDFTFLRCDRKSRGGGVAIGLRKTIPYCLISTFACNDCTIECISLDIYPNSSRCTRLILVYRAPHGDSVSFNLFTDYLLRTLPTKPSARYVLLGDFNLPLLVDIISPTCTLKSPDIITQTFADFCFQTDLFQHVNAPTRVNNTLDLIFTPNYANILSNVKVNMPIHMSDHSSVSFDLECSYCVDKPVVHARSFAYSKCNIRLATDMLTQTNWLSLFANCSSIDEAWLAFKNICLNVIRETTPFCTHKVRHKALSRFLRCAVLKKKRLWRKHVLLRLPKSLAAFKCQSKIVSTLFRQFRSRRELHILHTHNSSQFWRFCSRHMSRQHDSISVPMSHGDKIIHDIRDVPDSFNSFFTSVFRTNVPVQALPFPTNLYVPLLSNLYFTPNDVLQALSGLKLKYNSPDGIPAFFLKTFAPSLVYPVTTLFNFSLASASLPYDWKHAIITPIFKGKGSVSDVANYRPISCTSVTGKVLESLIKERLLAHFTANSLLSDAQFGFLPGRSTTSNLIYTDSLIHKELLDGNPTDVVFFDISKAFDTVPHSLLLDKLANSFGVVGKLLAWCKAFLSNRTQAVKVYPNHISRLSSVTSGVIQGSVLGPIFYAAYSNDIVKCFNYGRPVLYADDLKVIFPIHLTDTDKSFNLIMQDLNNLSAWSEATGLRFNFSKCLVLHYGVKNPNFVYNVCGNLLSVADSVIDLGVLRSNTLNYDDHCKNIIRRANCTCAVILRTFASRNASFMVKVFIAYVRPILEFASQIWSPYNIDFINRIERVQRLFTKRIRSVSHLAYDERLTRLGLQRLESRRLYLDLIFLAKLKFNFLHLTCNDFGMSLSRLHENKFISMLSNTRVSFYFFTARTLRLWNSLHNSITTACTFFRFRRLLSNVNFASYLRGRT